MTNDCIRIGLAEGRTSLKSLSLVCYPKLKSYELPSAYKLSAIFKSRTSILTHYRKLSKTHHVRTPYCTKPNLTTCYGLKVVTGKLRIPGNLEISLNRYVQHFLSQERVEVRSASLTPESLSITIRKQVEPAKPTRNASAIDRNLDNVTLADTENQVERYDLTQTTFDQGSVPPDEERRLSRNDVETEEEALREVWPTRRIRGLASTQRFSKHRSQR